MLPTLIGQGREAEVYTWAEGFVLKLFWPEFGREDVETEAELARQVWKAGVPSPKVEDVLEVEGRWGIVFERIAGVSLLEYAQDNLELLLESARRLAQLQRLIHGKTLDALPSQRERFIQRIRASKLSDKLKNDLQAHLGGLPDGNALCHGDFHPSNVLINTTGAYAIDWPNAVRGNPLADVARTALLLLYAALPPNLPSRRQILSARKWFCQSYLEAYLQNAPKADREELEAWMPVVAALRLREGIEEEEPQLMRMIRQGVKRSGG